MSSELMDNISKRMVKAELATASDLIGCTSPEIASIEKAAGTKLPEVYKDYLRTMGRSAGNFLEGSDFLYPDLLNLNKAANNMLEELGVEYRLTDTDFVFWMHQGYQFTFFDATAGDDPEVYLFSDSFEEPQKIAESFSDWLMGAVEEEAVLQGKLSKKGKA